MNLKPCGCGRHHYQRVRRAWWTRVFVWRRQYWCAKCGRVMLLGAAPVIAPEFPRFGSGH